MFLQVGIPTSGLQQISCKSPSFAWLYKAKLSALPAESVVSLSAL